MPKGQNMVVYLDGRSLTLQILDNVVSARRQIDLSPKAWKLVERSREAIVQMMQDPNKAVYGITTGFGSFANIPISKENRKILQTNLIRSHAVGVGNPISLSTVRRMIVLRINTLAKGRSGIHPQNLRKFIAAFNADFLPFIPEQGTVGASGDLAPLSHLALGLLGQGLAWDRQKGQFRPAYEILDSLGLKKLELEQKQGLALINGTQFMTSIISEVISRSQALLESQIVLYAFATQIFGVDRALFEKQSQQFYKKISEDLSDAIREIRGLIGEEQSQLHRIRSKNEEIQSLLDFPEAISGIKKTLAYCKKIVENEMNSATDNPLVYFKEDGFNEDILVSAGNFHGEYVAKAADFIGVLLFEMGKFSEARIQRYINGKISRLSPFLIKNGGLNSGFMISQYTSAALLSESKILVRPASVDSIVTSAGQEDHVSMGGYAARKASLLLNNIANISGIQLLLVLNALQERKERTSLHLEKIMEGVKKSILPLDVDRYYGPDISVAKEFILKGLRSLLC